MRSLLLPLTLLTVRRGAVGLTVRRAEHSTRRQHCTAASAIAGLALLPGGSVAAETAELVAPAEADAEAGAEASAEPEPASPPVGPTASDFDVPFRGEPAGSAPFLGRSATLAVNVKFDDPETIVQLPALQTLASKCAARPSRDLAET
jgi:hypothetical protein